ncbi:MAG: adenine deaminase [Planctomycetaceae bacterium]|nr:MAG: adenine deaminase [Planctomycetaceae bacterium]
MTHRDVRLVDIENRRISPARIVIADGRITAIEPLADPDVVAGELAGFALPGYVDAHVHIESSMLVPSEFARLAVVHGTVATVSDPHEIANVLGVSGVDLMIENGRRVPVKFFFGAPSCVPATSFETAGAVIDADQIGQLLERDEILYLAEMMNYPGVLHEDPQVMAKLAHAHRLGKPVDGHAPGLRNPDAARYAAAGITTDHECVSLDEAVDKLNAGMRILIREGSAAKNFDALFPLIDRYPGQVMFCSDDKHPDDLLGGHIDQLVRRAVAGGADPFHVLAAACLTPVRHYRLPIGTLQVGEPADFQIVDNLTDFRTRETFIRGELVAANGQPKFASIPCEPLNRFDCPETTAAAFVVPAQPPASTRSGVIPDPITPDPTAPDPAIANPAVTNSAFTDPAITHGPTATTDGPTATVRVIRAIDRSLLTDQEILELPIRQGQVVCAPSLDVLKLAVVNRYRAAPPAVAFIRGFGLRQGAIASSVGHDSHNILAVGGDDESLAAAANLVIRHRGGIVAVDGEHELVLPLPIAGLMTDRDGATVAAEYQRIDQFVKSELGCPLTAPFTTLSFMALLVIPRLKLSDLGLFDCATFQLIE